MATELQDFNVTTLSKNLEIFKWINTHPDNSLDMVIKNLIDLLLPADLNSNLIDLPLPADLNNNLNKAPGAVPSMASGAPLLSCASASQNQPPQQDVYGNTVS